MINYVDGDAAHPRGDGTKIIAHICNDSGWWGDGFVLAVSERWSKPRLMYKEWYKMRNGPLPLGIIQCVDVGSDIIVANMIAQRGLRAEGSHPPIRYVSLRRCLTRVGLIAQEQEATIHMPRIGCGLAGGKWEIIEEMIGETLSNHDVYVYAKKYD